MELGREKGGPVISCKVKKKKKKIKKSLYSLPVNWLFACLFLFFFGFCFLFFLFFFQLEINPLLSPYPEASEGQPCWGGSVEALREGAV